MSKIFDALVNRGEYLSAYYVSEQLGDDLRDRKEGIFTAWGRREGDELDQRPTPRQLVRGLRSEYFRDDGREYFAATAGWATAVRGRAANLYTDQTWSKRLVDWHQQILTALGYEAAPVDLTVHRAGRDVEIPVAFHGDGIVAIDCGWAATADAAVAPDNPGSRLLYPLRLGGERYETGAALASWLFQSELGGPGGGSPRFVLLLHGGVVILADRQSWFEGRWLAANLDLALERNDRSQQGELATLAALFCHEMLRPGDNDAATGLDRLLKASSSNAVGVSKELRTGLKKSVEALANEVLIRMEDQGVTPADLAIPGRPFAEELTRECLRYLYRIVFLLFAEARPELGIVPADDPAYESGYSLARLRELAARDEQLTDPESAERFHLFLSLDLLFDKVNKGHRIYGTEPDDDRPGDDEETRERKKLRRSRGKGLRFEALRSNLFEPEAIRLIRADIPDPHADDDSEATIDLRPRNAVLHRVLRLLTMKESTAGATGRRRRERGGFISYRNLGINQLGAVYEGLISYTGTIADQPLVEVRKSGKGDQGTWLVPANRQHAYDDAALVKYDDVDARRGLRGVVRHETGRFAYRLSGRERETTAAYYTPESLTKVTVELALKHRLDQERDAAGNPIRSRASDLLKLTICEPALGSGAFLNEAINQVAEEYLRRRQEERGLTIPTSELLTEKQKAKAYIALHNAYGVDLNPAGIELAEVSLWLNTMHPGMQAPWFGLHLRRGNSLIGARRAVYSAEDVASPAKAWLKAKGGLGPTPVPFEPGADRQEIPKGAVHQFLLPSPGWAAIATGKEAKEARPLAGEQLDQLGTWKKGILQRPKRSTAHVNKDGSHKRGKNGEPVAEAPSQYTRLRDAALRVEALWALVVKRMELSEQAVSRRVDVWGAASDPDEVDQREYAFVRVPEKAAPKEQVLEDLFEAADTPYWRLKKIMDAWCALWFWPLDEVGLLDRTASVYPVKDESASSASTAQADSLAQASLPPTHIPLVLFPDDTDDESVEQNESEDVTTRVEEAKPASVAKSKSPSKPKRRPRRRVVPLVDLDDWLDFLEAMLGTIDIPDEALISSFTSLEDLKRYEALLPGFMGMDQGDPESRFPWLHVIREIADREGFLHWELEFASVFANTGGFDLQLGNPPWYRPHWDENGVLAEFEPWFELTEKPSEGERSHRRQEIVANANARQYLLNEMTKTSAQVAYFGSPQIYPYLIGAQPDLYRAFMCQTWLHETPGGTVGMIHPSTHFSGHLEGTLRREVYSRLRIHGDFVNSGQRFFLEPVSDTTHFGVHIYGTPRLIDFDHLSWLVSTDALRHSKGHDGSGEIPGVRYRNAEFDERPHRARVVRVTPEVLNVWQRLVDEEHQPPEQARLLFPVSTGEAETIEALARYRLRLAHHTPQIAIGFNETSAKETSLIEYNRKATQPSSWDAVVLKGVQLGVATPVFKRHDANSNDPYGWDLTSLPVDFVPDSAFVAVESNRVVFEAARDRERWVDHVKLARLRADPFAVAEAREFVLSTYEPSQSDIDDLVETRLTEMARRPHTAFYRLAWRRQIAPNTERALYAALIPPGPTYVDFVHSVILPTVRQTALAAGFWAALPLDYFLRATNRNDLKVAGMKSMPAPDRDHPLASALLLRTLRLNCLTSAYADLWAELYDRAWPGTEHWAYGWSDLADLQEITSDWRWETPLRTERARRSALVEIDALVAVWLGMSADALVAAYRGRFPVLQKYESVTWFDANGSKIAGNARTFGQRQQKDSWEKLQKYLVTKDPTDVPDGYTPPFYKADREAEMRAAHAVFQKRLDDAIERGEWDPERREVPGR